MKYQRTGLQASLLIHTAVFVCILGASRLIVAPTSPIPLELGIIAGLRDVPRNGGRQDIVHRQQKKAVAQETVPQQKIPSETAVADKPAAKQEQTSRQTATDEPVQAGKPGSSTNGPEVVGPVFDADYLHNPKPPYPLVARRMKLEGTVIVRVLVSPAGRPEAVNLGKSSGVAVLDQAALTAVQSWSFIPAREGSRPVPAWVDIPIHFHLI